MTGFEQNDQAVEQWGMLEIAAYGPMDGNPYRDVQVWADFRFGHRVVRAAGFYDGDGLYRVRFMPDTLGEWTFTTRSSAPGLNGHEGGFMCIEPAEGNHGPVRVRDQYHFAYADGTPYYPFGTTCYVWQHQGDEQEEQTLESLKHAPFNKIRMCVFPKHYRYNEKDPDLFPFEGSVEAGWDFTRPNPVFFRKLDFRILNLLEIGIEADLILFHPYDRWGFASMGAEANDFYVRYVSARLSAYRNIWWALANEYDLMKTWQESDWERTARIIQECDPYGRLRSIHNWYAPHLYDAPADLNFYDHNKQWVTHQSIQHSDMALVRRWRGGCRKPVVVDECCYEGNIFDNWGNITANELVHRIWEGTVRGGYVGHGETYEHEDGLWWSHGGVLRGESPLRIAFLRRILEEGPAGTQPDRDSIGQPCIGIEGRYYLVYCGGRQPNKVVLNLPEGEPYQVELIDTWGMTIQELPKPYAPQSEVPLPGKPYMALRITR